MNRTMLAAAFLCSGYTRPARLLSLLAILTAIFALAGCDAREEPDRSSLLAPGNPRYAKIASIGVAPAAPRAGDSADHADLVIDDDVLRSAQLTVVAYDARGVAVPKTGNASWAVSDTAIATVSPGGVLTGRRSGETLVTAAVQGVSASMRVCAAARLEAVRVVADSAPTMVDSLAPGGWGWRASQTTQFEAYRLDGTRLSNACAHWTYEGDAAYTLDRAGRLARRPVT
jgi:hypothetical protein